VFLSQLVVGYDYKNEGSTDGNSISDRIGVIMKLISKLFGYLNYVPKQWLDKKTAERDKLQDANKVYEALLNTNLQDKARLATWSKNVRANAKHICDICCFTDIGLPKDLSRDKHGKRVQNFLTAHHLYDKSIHPTLMYIPENGVCLCNECHVSFHSKYTSKSHCTPSMYQKFKHWKQGQITLGIKD
jgi:hypothetical protein